MYYTDFYLSIYEINGKSIDITSFTDNINANIDNNDELTEYDLGLKYGSNKIEKPMILTSNIKTKESNSDFILAVSDTNDFKTETENALIKYLDNKNIYFNVINSDKLEAFSTNKDKIIEENTALIISIIIVSIGTITSILAFIFNKIPTTKIDNAKFWIPLLICLGIYDFISDINLTIQIFKHKNIYKMGIK